MRCLQVWKQADVSSCGKLVMLKQLLRTWSDDAAGDAGAPHRVLLFSNSTRMLGVVREVMTAEGYSYEYLDGQTKQEVSVVSGFVDEELWVSRRGAIKFAGLLGIRAGPA